MAGIGNRFTYPVLRSSVKRTPVDLIWLSPVQRKFAKTLQPATGFCCVHQVCTTERLFDFHHLIGVVWSVGGVTRF